jgi:hypothetical protein
MGPRRQDLIEPGSTKGLITFTSSDAEERRCTRSSCPSMRFTDALLPTGALNECGGRGFWKI